ncbi:hypothetical protein MTQ01_21600 [Streptomyces sp. XM4193]|uniref:hypothetical protein n=1 Tax=Streptomyces sp. XM4193 TaxID=2929782 RepID=UPI001FFBDF8F|nr:hypothetical protein [Streptomyces sp. XM4193]MCK1798573.1 hypothetical protein [Streptomyces sp. XM4193]
MTQATEHGGPPAEPPVPADVDIMSRDVRWFAHATGADWPPPAQRGHLAAPRPDTEVAPALPESARGGASVPLPPGTSELLENAAHPAGRPVGAPDAATALGHALVTGFGIQRKEPENPFNDHRGYPSVRAKFPVQVFVRDGERARVLDPYRHALTALAGDGAPAAGREVLLAGRYTRLPDSYRWFRGTLVNLELGINLRQLCLGMELFGLSGRLRLPGPDARRDLDALGLSPHEEWTLPLAVELTDEDPAPAAAAQGAPDPLPPERVADPVLAETVALNRAQDFGRSEPLGPAVPEHLPQAPISWAEVLWRRSAGRMPRGLYGMSGRRRTVGPQVLEAAARWLTVPPPGDTLAAVWDEVRITGVLQDVEGHVDGVYRLHDGRPSLLEARPGAPEELEGHYAYRVDPYNGGDIRHATAVWFLSAHPRTLVERFGPGAFTAAQYAAGWAAQGVGLAAAASGLYARPARAFQEVPAQRLLGLDTDEMVLCAVITGTPRFSGPMYDLRL